MEKLLTVKEFAETVRLSEKTIQRHIQAGDIEVLRYGSNGQPVRIQESQIEPFMKKAYKRFKGYKVLHEVKTDIELKFENVV